MRRENEVKEGSAFNRPALGLGTAQLGLPYGIANVDGMPGESERTAMLEECLRSGIGFFDTAAAYGESEEFLGQFFRSRRQEQPVYMSKLSAVPAVAGNAQECLKVIREQIVLSQKRLNVSCLDYYLLHRAEDLKNENILTALQKIKEEGLVSETGVSVYEREEAYLALDKGLTAIQFPLNLFDQRFADPVFLSYCREKKALLFARSVFLQGLFFLESDNLPAGLEKARPYLLKLAQICREARWSIQEICLGFLKQAPDIYGIIVGAESAQQVREICRAYHEADLAPGVIRRIKECFADVPQAVRDPRCWPLVKN